MQEVDAVNRLYHSLKARLERFLNRELLRDSDPFTYIEVVVDELDPPLTKHESEAIQSYYLDA
jgi:hypothetical protein